MIKELAEDIKRYRADREINARLVLVFNTDTKAFEDRPWRAVKVCAVHIAHHNVQLRSSQISNWHGNSHGNTHGKDQPA